MYNQNANLVRTKLISQREWCLQPQHMETCRGQVSQTVPNESYSIQELFKKHAANMMPPIGREPVFHGGDHDAYDVEKLAHEDLVDKEDIVLDLKRRNRLRQKEVDEFELKQKADSAAKAQAEEEALLAKLQSRLTGAQPDASK